MIIIISSLFLTTDSTNHTVTSRLPVFVRPFKLDLTYIAEACGATLTTAVGCNNLLSCCLVSWLFLLVTPPWKISNCYYLSTSKWVGKHHQPWAANAQPSQLLSWSVQYVVNQCLHHKINWTCPSHLTYFIIWIVLGNNYLKHVLTLLFQQKCIWWNSKWSYKSLFLSHILFFLT